MAAVNVQTDVRSQVINGMAEGIGPVIQAIDVLEAAAQGDDPKAVRAAGRRLFKARDELLAPIVRRAEEGLEW